ncbi:hypothetical protein KR026_012176, partial [Drosophila bipectinata]
SKTMWKLEFFVLLAMVLRTMSIESFDCTANGTLSTKFCSSSCPETCEFDPPYCSFDCGAPCICKPGYIIDEAIPACVLRFDCPKHVKQVRSEHRIENFPCFGANRECK